MNSRALEHNTDSRFEASIRLCSPMKKEKFPGGQRCMAYLQSEKTYLSFIVPSPASMMTAPEPPLQSQHHTRDGGSIWHTEYLQDLNKST
jgi:hypothetical protein